MHCICCGVIPPSWAPATLAVAAGASEMAKHEAMRRRVSRTENPPGSVARAIVGANCTRCAVAPGRKSSPGSLALGAAHRLLLLLPRAHPVERLAGVDVGDRSRLRIREGTGEALPSGRGLPQPLAEDREQDPRLLLAVAGQGTDPLVEHL